MSRAEYALPARATLQEVTGIALAGAAALFFAAALAFRIERATDTALWSTALTLTLLCGAGIVIIWYFATSLHSYEGVAVTSRAAVDRYVELYTKSLSRDEVPVRVPTGVQLTAIRFPDPTSVLVNGYVWQRYADSLPDDIARGFALTQLNSDEFLLEELERVRQGTNEIILWWFGAVLQQNSDPAWFPFDRRDIAIRITPAELDRNVVLIPDFEAYKLINPRSLPGVNKDVRISNWELQGSYFSYQTTTLDTNLGLPSLTERANTPVLYFNIETRRNFIGPFIAYLLPGIVGAVLTFAFLMSDREVGDQQDLISALSYAAAMFFVIVIAHTALRESVGAVKITYLEHLYILLYALVLLVIIDVFLVVRRPSAALVQYRNNLISKLLYWPVFGILLLLSTVVVFVLG